MTETVLETDLPESIPPEAPEPDEAPEATPDEPTPDGTPAEEPGEPDADTPGEPETPETPETVPGEVPAGLSPEAMEKEFKRVDRAAQRWHDTVVEFITTTEQPIIRCQACLPGMPGFLFTPAAQAPSEDQVKFARALAGMPEQPPLVQAANARTCPACEGWGDVLTGSKRNDQIKMRCNTCQGRGFVGDGPAITNGTTSVTQPLELAPLETAPDDSGDKDPWGRPPEHPGYMIFPHEGMDAALRPPGWPS